MDEVGSAVARFTTAEPDTHCRVAEVTHSLNMLNEFSQSLIPERDTKVTLTVLMSSLSLSQTKEND